MYSTDPNHLQQFRETTVRQRPLVHRIQLCPSCMKRRSAGQFAPGKTKCNTCRGVK